MAEMNRRVYEDEMFNVDEDDEDTLANKYLIFHVASETYGVEIRYVTDIVEIQKITEVPEMPDYIKGVINLRGNVIPVIDVRIRFSLPAREYDDRTCIIIITAENKQVGFIVDTVSEILEIAETNVAPPPQFKKDGIKHKYIKGLGKVGEEVKILLDIDRILFEDENIEAVEEVIEMEK